MGNKKAGKWQSSICFNRKLLYLGIYENETDATMAYNAKAVELFGEFAKLNDI